MLQELVGYRLDTQVTVCIVAVLEYVAADILKLVGNYVKHIQAKEITEEDVRVSMCADKVSVTTPQQDLVCADKVSVTTPQQVCTERFSVTTPRVC